MSPKRRQNDLTGGFRDREVNLEKIQHHKANVIEVLKNHCYINTSKDISAHQPSDFPTIHSISLWDFKYYAPEMDMGKKTELLDFYQCHKAGGLSEMHINYIFDHHCRKIDPTDNCSGVWTSDSYHCVLSTSKIHSRTRILFNIF